MLQRLPLYAQKTICQKNVGCLAPRLIHEKTISKSLSFFVCSTDGKIDLSGL